MNVITKSGTRDFHGSVYYFKRHEMFNANSFFNNRDSITKPLYRFNTEGVAVGGPDHDSQGVQHRPGEAVLLL